ncbi:MAG: hypothetical protein ACRBCS_10900 [Cellvibrionaceae bacterium]
MEQQVPHKKNKTAVLLNLAAIAVTLLYPFAIYFGLQHFDPRTLILILIAIVGIRFLTLKNSPLNHWVWIPLLGVLCVWVWISNSGLGLKFYPVLINTSFLILFCWSLKQPPTMIERFARLKPAMLEEIKVSPDSDEILPDVKKYMGKVTIVWCCFFVVNGLTALGLAFWGSDKIWTLYNGIVSYLMIGVLFVVEWLVRQRVIKKIHG